MESSDNTSFTWKPPRDGFFKVNTDGAWMNSSIASGGGVIRGTDGSWYKGFACNYDGAISPLAAELYAMYDGLAIAESLEIKKVEVETDAASLTKMIDTAGANPYHELAAAIMDVADLLKKFETAIVTHIPRENNELDHILAKYGKEMAVGYTTFHYVPECAAALYERDRNGAAKAGPN